MPKRENQELDVLDAVADSIFSQLQQFGIQALPTAQGRSFPQLSASLEALNDRVQESASPVYSAATCR